MSSSAAEGLRANFKTTIDLSYTSLENDKRCFPTSMVICASCSRTCSNTVVICGACNSPQAFPKYCTSEVRVSDYVSALTTLDLYGTSACNDTSAPQTIADRISMVKDKVSHQPCQAGASCSLFGVIKGLENGVQDSFQAMKNGYAPDRGRIILRQEDPPGASTDPWHFH